MFDKNYLLPADALALIVNALPGGRPQTEELPIEECYARIIAVDVVSREDLPGFSRSTVDGYAVHAEDTFGAKDTSPAYLSLKREVLMGKAPDFELGQGVAAKIPTGGMLPPGSDAVIMLEHVQPVPEDMIEIMRASAPGDNVIQRGDDIRKGETVLTAGKVLRAQDIGALAGIGVTNIEVFKKPVVSFISTGDELVSPDSPLLPGQVRDINSFTLAGLAMKHGSVMLKKGIIRDNYEDIRKALEESLLDSDMVVISGGTSAGTKDMTAAIINDIGRPGVLFHGVSLKPGKPMIGGVAQGKPVFGLPGHPAAIVVCFELFIEPVLNRLRGLERKPDFSGLIKATMAKDIVSAAGREDHIRVSVEEKEGKLLAFPVLGKSGLITTLVKADGIVMIPEWKPGLDAGEEVTVRLF